MDLGLEGKCVIVTGGTRNLGKAISLGFLREGANVIASYLQNTASAEEFLSIIPLKQKDNIRIHKLDASSDMACRKICSIAQDEFGGLDALVNNAAAILIQDIDKITNKHFDEILRHTLRGTIYMMRAACKLMKQNGNGRIVNISSAGVYTGNPAELLYLCAKGGVEAATRAFARFGAPHKITANAVAPHVIDAGMGRDTISRDQAILDRIPLHRMGRLDEFVSLVLFLSSSICEYMTGQIIHFNGGRLMQ